MKIGLLLFVSLALSFNSFAQKHFQSIYGQVLDKQTKTPLPGASIIVENSDLKLVATSDQEGNFVINNVPVGRQVLRITYLGYLPLKTEAIILISAKSSTVKIELVTGAIDAKEVIINANKNAFEPLNELSVVSTRSFTSEETERMPAGVNDPGRVALSYPGVQRGPDDTENQIVVRGNSPIGILWRLEGIDMPNPNHFAVVGSSGGGVSVFSAQLLGKSDFSTGGFAAEYGNAVSGAFDVQFRHGDMYKRVHRARVGILGLDFATEGPIKNGTSSYLVNYRYSTLGLLGKMGFYLVGERVTNDFQDLSFNLVFKKKKSVSTIFGIGGLSEEHYLPVANGADRNPSRANEWEDRVRPSNMGAVGYTYTYLPDSKTNLKFSMALVGSDQIRNSDTLNVQNVRFRYNTERYLDKRLVVSFAYSKRITEKFWIKTGAIANQIFYDFFKQTKARLNLQDINQRSTNVSVQGDGSSQMLQTYFQTTYKLSSKFSLNTGMHFLYFVPNKTGSIEPRVSMQYAPTAASKVSFAYGRHGKILPMMTYFFADTLGNNINFNLKPIKSDHFIAAFHHYTKNRMRLSLEAYYQNMFNVPISADVSSNYWLLNFSADFPEFAVKSKGLGRNKGIDLAIEKQFSNSYFFLVTGSVLDSKFKANDGVWHNSRFNTRFSSSYTLGKEFQFKNGNILQIGGRFLFSGGFRYTPFDPVSSKQKGFYVADRAKENDGQVAPFQRLDTRIAYRFNRKKTSGNISLDFQNATNRLNPTSVAYDSKTNTTYTQYRGSGFIPVLTYQLDF